LPFFKKALEANSTVEQFWISYIDALIKTQKTDEAKAAIAQAKDAGVKDEALEIFEINVSATPQADEQGTNPQDPPQEQVDTIITIYSQKQSKKALYEASKLLSQFPNSAVLYNFIGAVNASLEQYDEAIEAYQKTLSINPKLAEPYNNMGNAYKAQAKFNEAIKAYENAIAISPEYTEAYYNKGIAFHEQDKLDEAIKAYEKAISIKSDYVDAIYNMGNLFLITRKFKKAIKAYKETISINPNHREAFNNLGNIYKTQGKLDEAIVAYRSAISVDSEYAEAYNNIGVILKEQSNLDQAIEAFRKALKINPEYSEAHYNLGNTFKEQGSLKNAIPAYESAILFKPDYFDAYYNKGNVLKEYGKLQLAIDAFTIAIDIKPEYAETYNNLANTLKETGNLKKAIKTYNKAISLNPEYAEAYNNMGTTLYQQGKLDEAINAYKKALALKPEYVGAYNNMGVALQNQGNLSEAKKAYERAILIEPDYSEAHRHLSNINNYSVNDPHLIQVENLYKAGGLTQDTKCNLSFTLAKMYEDLDKFEKSFRYLSEGNDLRKKLLKYSIDKDKKLFRQLKKGQPNILNNALEVKKETKDLKPIFIVGMPRSGTTLVEQIISSHSMITAGGELSYVLNFGVNLSLNTVLPNTENISEFRQRYLSELAKLSKGARFITDKMPHNFRFIPLICAALPEAKIIHVLRDPKATCWSNFKQYFDTPGLGYCYNLKDVVDYYGLYNSYMKFLHPQYNSQIYNLDYDNLTENQGSETKKIIKYLGLEWQDACLQPQNNERSVRTASQQQVRQKVYQGSSEAWRKYESFLNGAFDSLLS